MRGRFNVGLSGVVWPRNTPAYAGKTSSDLLVCLYFREHPRVCGENQGSWASSWQV